MSNDTPTTLIEEIYHYLNEFNEDYQYQINNIMLIGDILEVILTDEYLSHLSQNEIYNINRVKLLLIEITNSDKFKNADYGVHPDRMAIRLATVFKYIEEILSAHKQLPEM